LQNTNFPSELSNLRFLLASLYFEYSKKTYSDLSLESLAKELLNILLEDFQHYKYVPIPTGGFEIIRQTKGMLSNSTNLRIYKTIDYICQNYQKKLKLEDIAAKEYISVSHLSRCIKQVSGMTFSQLLSLTRCEEAERLLCYTKKTVDAIANEVGFSTRKELAINFNKWYKKTPSAFRNDLIPDLEKIKGKTCNTFDYNFAILILNTYLDGY
jgi:AraC-like DNA-binding protein